MIVSYLFKLFSNGVSGKDTIFNILDDAKTENIKIVDLKNKSSIADAFI